MRDVNKSRVGVAYTKHLRFKRFNACMTSRRITPEIDTFEATGQRKARSRKSKLVVDDLSQVTGDYITVRALVRESEWQR
jgi:hypothetical protein